MIGAIFGQGNKDNGVIDGVRDIEDIISFQIKGNLLASFGDNIRVRLRSSHPKALRAFYTGDKLLGRSYLTGTLAEDVVSRCN